MIYKGPDEGELLESKHFKLSSLLKDQKNQIAPQKPTLVEINQIKQEGGSSCSLLSTKSHSESLKPQKTSLNLKSGVL